MPVVPGVPVIAIDGPGGSGKGTVAGRVAGHLGWHLLDSGALYRIVAWAAVDRGVALDAADELARLVGALGVRFTTDSVSVDGRDVTTMIRTEAVSEGASRVAALEPVRHALLTLQRAQRRFPGLVADGRDMGTVVFADAPLKIYLDAAPEVRAKRRYNQLKNKGLTVSLADLLASIQERDARDRRRAVSPLKPAPDAIAIDSTELTIEQVVARVLAEAARRGLSEEGDG